MPVTFSLIAASVAVFLGVVLLAGSGWGSALAFQPAWVIQGGGLEPQAVAGGALWRLLSSMFLHAGLIHVAVNMMALYFLGSFAEQTFGSGRFFALYLVSGIAGGVAYLYFGSFTTPAVGASGAIFGILGGILGFAIRRGTFSMRNPVIRQLVLIAAINLFIGASIPNVSNTAHIGGLIGGFFFGTLIANSIYSQKRSAVTVPLLTTLGLEAVLVGIWLFSVTGGAGL
jgi:rhomboid protease GluP